MKKIKATLNICNYGSIILHSINNKLNPPSTFENKKEKPVPTYATYSIKYAAVENKFPATAV